MPQVTIPLRTIAYCRSGDKGDVVNISVLYKEPKYREYIVDQIDETFVRRLLPGRKIEDVKIYEVPNLMAFNYVISGALEGGVNSSLGLDGHGKALSFLFLAARIRIDLAILTDEEAEAMEEEMAAA
jgi:hypothetical protein